MRIFYGDKGSDFICGIDNDFTKPILQNPFGTSIIISGWFYHKKRYVRKIEFLVDNKSFNVCTIHRASENTLENLINDKMTDINLIASLSSRFWSIIDIPFQKNNSAVSLAIKVILDNNEFSLVNIGVINVSIIKDKNLIALSKNKSLNSPLVAVCMATYNPNLDFLKKQIESIKAQTYNNWICIISDDCSLPEVYEGIKKEISNDNRFHIFRNENNLGFYYNFERTLYLVPNEVEYIALCDQDDYWHNDKIEKSLNKFDKNTQLVYCDMNLIDEMGNYLAETYWMNRKNNYSDLEWMILANTVTGAATVFKRSLLDRILPFPERIGYSFHDWWIALCALMEGKINYIDEPLYDYRQHGNNVIGHQRKVKLSERFVHFKDIRNILHVIKVKISDGLNIYNLDYKRLRLNAITLKNRFSHVHRGKLDIMEKISLSESVYFYSKLFIKNKLTKRDTLNTDLRLLFCIAIKKIMNSFYYIKSSIYPMKRIRDFLVKKSN
jgi:glycosyltransferase involved in cell wall biosynthesis